MQTKESIQTQLDSLKRQYGDWAYDIPLPFGIWTKGNLQLPHTRLKRIVQIINDLTTPPLNECRILDLGCLDGIFSIEFAKHGAKTVGVEIREDNIEKAIFSKKVLELHNLEFRQDDVRNISIESYGKFDAIVCSGILYHLPANDAINLINSMYELTNRVVVIDTHVALKPIERFVIGDDEYWGSLYFEHSKGATPEEKAKRLLSSADNSESFWFTRPSLVNILNKAGFSSVFECFTPTHLNFGKPGLEHQDRCTFVALKEEVCEISTSPAANNLQENWPEHCLSYTPFTTNQYEPRPLHERVVSLLRKIIS